MSIRINEVKRHQKVVQQTLLVLYFLLSYNGVQGEKNLSELEDAELEKQLKLLNKPAIKTIKTKYADLYDCVDFYKQITFDHPLLKDHDFHPEMKPTLSRKKKNLSDSTASRSPTIWSKEGGCPIGTVPVKRITKDDLIRQRLMPPPEDVTSGAQFDISNNNSEPNGRYISSQGYKVAIALTPNYPNNKFTGAGMTINFFNPHVEGRQHSACRLKVQKDSDILQVGWRVDPTLYGDSKTRLFIHSQFGKTQCFNTLCPGFVHVNTDIPLDLSYMDYVGPSKGKPYEDIMYIEQDLANGNWWLLLSTNYEKVGFWPHRIFTGLPKFATNVEWGGVVYSPPGVPEPPMGSGSFPTGDSTRDAYCRSVTVLNEKGKTIQLNEVTLYSDNPDMYKVKFNRLTNGTVSYRFILFGGSGEKVRTAQV